MTKDTSFLDTLDKLKKYLTEIFAIEYGDNLSMDELIKFKSMDKLSSLTLRERQRYLNKCQYIIQNFEKKDIIDYILTLSKLYTDGKLIDKFFSNNETLMLLEIFNHISINEYSVYLDLLNDLIYMKRLNEKVNNITRNQEDDRKLAIIRDICSQFVTYLQKYKEENKDFSNISRDNLGEVIASFVPRGISTSVHESINNNTIKR